MGGENQDAQTKKKPNNKKKKGPRRDGEPEGNSCEKRKETCGGRENDRHTSKGGLGGGLENHTKKRTSLGVT